MKITEPVAWRYLWPEDGHPKAGWALTADPRTVEYARKQGLEVQPLYTEPVASLERVVEPWISVDERLPVEDETVLAWEIGPILAHRSYQGYWVTFDDGYECSADPSHWMLIPKSPQREPVGSLGD